MIVGAIKAAYAAAEERLHSLIVQLEESGHELADEFRKVFDQLHGRVPAVEAEAKADAEQVAHDAVAAEAPVVNEAVQDVAAIADTAVTSVSTPAAETKTA